MRFRRLGMAAFAVILVAPAAACSSHPKVTYTAVTTPRPIGQGVAQVLVQGSKVPTTTKSVVDTHVKLSVPSAVGVGPVLAITPAGKLPAKVTLSFPVSGSAKSLTDLYVASAESANGPWRLEPTVLAKDGRSLQVTTDHFSFWSRVKLDVAGAMNELKHQFLDGISGDLTTEAEKPSCQNESQARTSGYTISSTAKNTLYWCFGLENGQRVLKVVNRRRYPLEITHTGLKFLSRSRTAVGLANLAQFAAYGSIVMPFQEADFRAELAPGGHGSLSTELSSTAQSFYQLEVGLTTAASIITRFGANEELAAKGALNPNSFDKLAEKIDKALSIPGCLNAFHNINPGEMLKNCLSPARMVAYFGWQGVILAPFVTTGSLLEFFRSEFDAIGDQLNGRDKYVVTVKHGADSRLARYVGYWSGHDTAVTINSNGTGELNYRLYGCPLEDTTGDQCYEYDKFNVAVYDNYITATITGQRFEPSSYKPKAQNSLGSVVRFQLDPNHSDVLNWVQSGSTYHYCKQGGPSDAQGLCGA